MQQPETLERGLFPKLPATANSVRAVDHITLAPAALVQASDKVDEQTAFSGLTKSRNNHTPSWHRKLSVREVGPMTMVHEFAVDSPTIPDRRQCHDRSVHAPGSSPRKRRPTDILFRLSRSDEGPSLQSVDKQTSKPRPQGTSILNSDACIPQLRQQHSPNCSPTRDDSLPRGRFEGSPQNRTSFASKSSLPGLATHISAPMNATSCIMLSPPVSAPVIESHTSSQTLRNVPYTPPISKGASNPFHRYRGRASEVSGIMEPSQPRNRSGLGNDNGPITRKTNSSRSKSSKNDALERLTAGLKHADATKEFEASELTMLQKQALGQVKKFEILKATDVEMLCTELRYLDKRTEYLRRTYNTLHVDRRNLHSRICQRLRSPRVAQFSHAPLLRHEEALAELDTAIDGWFNELKRAESRRTRVQQKLLEHVAAVASLPLYKHYSPSPPQESPSNAPLKDVENITTGCPEVRTSSQMLVSTLSPKKQVL
ncbi:Up-regulated during septation-domain-containing protein [Fusarium oxysporum f. sp. albedinis]|nr:Up-regulated during septation-domain-containing protein [Fusarium oxysporum f. sp. albedinis]KAK2469362.1 hypothetical protein H9L39_19079 [Fusarium oxysporum f. sp. albedinis]